MGTKGSLVVGRPPRLVNVDICDEHGVRSECVPSFYERFEQAFLLEAQDFVRCVAEGCQPRCSLADAAEATRIAIATTTSYRRGERVVL